MGKEQELRSLVAGYARFEVDDLERLIDDREVHQATCADIRRMAELLASSSSSDEQAEVVAWQVTQYDPNGRLNDASVSLVRGALPTYYRTERWGSSGHAMWEVIPLYRAPAVAAGGVTVDPDLLAKQSTIEPDIAAVVYPNRSKLYSDFSGGVTDQAVEAACKAFYGEAAWQFPRGIISKPSSIIAMRRALTAALAVGADGP